MGVQDSFSRLKKKVKRLGNKRKPNRIGADIAGESIDPGNLPSQPEPHLIAGDREGNEADAEGCQRGETQPVPASGNKDGEGSGEASTHGKEVSQRGSHGYQDVEVVMGSWPSQEGNHTNRENVYPRSSTPPIPCGGKPDSM